MVKEAIVALKDRTGSSVQAISKYMKANYDLPDNFGKILSRALKRLVDNGKLVKVKASYKLGSLKAAAPKKKVVKKIPAMVSGIVGIGTQARKSTFKNFELRYGSDLVGQGGVQEIRSDPPPAAGGVSERAREPEGR